MTRTCWLMEPMASHDDGVHQRVSPCEGGVPLPGPLLPTPVAARGLRRRWTFHWAVGLVPSPTVMTSVVLCEAPDGVRWYDDPPR